MGSVGDNIRRLRTGLGISQGELARRIGKTRSCVSQYERGDIMPRMGTVERLARALGCSKTDIVGDAPHGGGFARLSAIWDRLPDGGRSELLRYAAYLDSEYRKSGDKGGMAEGLIA